MTKEFMRLMDAAEYLGVSDETIRNYIRRYDLPYVMLGKRKKVFRKSDIDKWLDERKRTGWVRMATPFVNPFAKDKKGEGL